MYIKGIVQLLNEPIGFVYLNSQDLIEEVQRMEVKGRLRKTHRENEKGIPEDKFLESTSMTEVQLKKLVDKGVLIRVFKHSKPYILKNQYLDMLVKYLKKTGTQVKEFTYEKLKYCKQK